MSARLNVPCSVNGRDEMEIVAYPDGSFEFVARTRAAGAVAPMGGGAGSLGATLATVTGSSIVVAGLTSRIGSGARSGTNARAPQITKPEITSVPPTNRITWRRAAVSGLCCIVTGSRRRQRGC